MENKYKISIPEPCHEDWDKMTPEKNGRFCNSCTKNVVDFTGMSALEIQNYFIANHDKKTCGRFKNEQLNRFEIQIPEYLFNKQMAFHKAFLLVLFAVMGSSLFSCKNHNDDYVNGEPVIVKDTIKKHITVGMVIPRKPNTFLINEKVVEDNSDSIYNVKQVDIMPSFPNGIKEFYKFFGKNFVNPENQMKHVEKIMMSFIVDTDGSIKNIKVLNGENENLNKEAVRVMKLSPNWNAGEFNGKKVKILYSFPLIIQP